MTSTLENTNSYFRSALSSLAWLRSHDGGVAAPQTGSVNHIHENLSARDIELDAEDIVRIDDVVDRRRCETPDSMEW